jgi:hypothetical protein
VVFSPAQITAADAAFKEIVASHPEALTELIVRLSTTWERASVDLSDEKIAACFSVAHDLSGLGETLGMPLVSTWSRSLRRFLKLSFKAREAATEVIEAHIAAIGLMGRRRVAAEGDEMSRLIEAELQTAIVRFGEHTSAIAENSSQEQV